MPAVDKAELYAVQDATQFKTVCLCYSCSPCAFEMPGEGLAKIDNFCGCQKVAWCLCCQQSCKGQCTEMAAEEFCCKDAPGNPCFQGNWITCCNDITKQCCCIAGMALPPTEEQPLGCGLCGFMVWDPAGKWANK